MLIDLPQVVDVVANPQGPAFLSRDVAVMATWFRANGTPADAAALTREALAAAGLGVRSWGSAVRGARHGRRNPLVGTVRPCPAAAART